MTPQRLALASTKIRHKVYSIGRVIENVGPVIIEHIKVKAGGAAYVGRLKDVIFWLTQHGLSPQEAGTFVAEGLAQFDEREKRERAARIEARKN